MYINLYPHQEKAIEKLKNGSILVGGVGSGKSRTSLAYYFVKECGGKLNPFTAMTKPKSLYIITTAMKRNSLEWDEECLIFRLSQDPKASLIGTKVVIDSWNNIKKYVDVKNAFFIFDEQRVVGSGVWVKSFIKIAKANRWILLSATPGDTWTDYIPVFIANGFYKNRTEFCRRHVVYNHNVKFPKVDRYIETKRLMRLRDEITVEMPYAKPTTPHHVNVKVNFDKPLLLKTMKSRWDPYKDEPIQDISNLCYILRRIVNSDPSRLSSVIDIMKEKKKVIIFYTFNYELDVLRQLSSVTEVAEWNGSKHEYVPSSDSWVYLVQYTAGAEGWNCITTDTIIFYSQSYSYRTMSQAAGRIDRLNTPFKDLYYYHLISSSSIDFAIKRALDQKKDFNEKKFVGGY